MELWGHIHSCLHLAFPFILGFTLNDLNCGKTYETASFAALFLDFAGEGDQRPGGEQPHSCSVSSPQLEMSGVFSQVPMHSSMSVPTVHCK